MNHTATHHHPGDTVPHNPAREDTNPHGPAVEEMDRLAEYLAVTVAPFLTWAVHNRDADMVAELLDPLTRLDLLALAVAMASQALRPRSRPDDGIIDPIVVERVADGHLEPLTRAERAAVIRKMVGRRVPQRRICEYLQVSSKTIQRVLAETAEARPDENQTDEDQADTEKAA